jgi:hypothetical protein
LPSRLCITGAGNPTGEDIPNGAQTATQSDMGADLGESPGHATEVLKWRHLIRRPAKLTGTRHELCTWREPTRPGVGSLSRKRYTHSTLNTTERDFLQEQDETGK